jgi:hypothetical protein
MPLPLVAFLTLFAPPGAFGGADPPPAEQLAAAKRELETVWKDYGASMEKAKDPVEQKQVSDTIHKRGAIYLQRCVSLAEQHPNDPVAVDALSYILAGNPLGYHDATSGPINRAYTLLAERYAGSDRLVGACRFGYRYAANTTAAETFLRAVLAQNRSAEIQARACLSLSTLTEEYAQLGTLLRDPARAKELRAFLPVAVIRHVEAIDAEKYARESDALLERVVAEFPDVKSTGAATLGDVARGKLFHRRNLVVGKEAPELQAEDIEGKQFKLSNYRGKVVLLDFWASW